MDVTGSGFFPMPRSLCRSLSRWPNTHAVKAQGFRAFKIGWGPFGRRSNGLDEQIVRAAREAVGDEALLMVDAGASDAFWQQGYKWALRTADMLADYDVKWFEEPLPPDNLADYVF